MEEQAQVRVKPMPSWKVARLASFSCFKTQSSTGIVTGVFSTLTFFFLLLRQIEAELHDYYFLSSDMYFLELLFVCVL